MEVFCICSSWQGVDATGNACSRTLLRLITPLQKLSLNSCFRREIKNFAVNNESEIKMSEISQQISSLQSLSMRNMGYFVAIYLQHTMSRTCTHMWARSLITGLGFDGLEENTAVKPRLPLLHQRLNLFILYY